MGLVGQRLAQDRPAFQVLVNLISKKIERRVLQKPVTDETSSISTSDLKDIINNVHAALAESKAASGGGDIMLLDEALGFYFTQLFEGKYVDRFGNTLQAPTVSMTITDSEIGGALSVLVDVIMDYVLRSPVWVDNVNVNSSPKNYPADYASTSSPGSAVSTPTPPAAKPAAAAAAPASQSLVPTAVAFDQELINDYAKNPADFPYSPGTKSDGTTWRWTPLAKLGPLPSPPPPGYPSDGACQIDQRKLEVIEYLAGLIKQESTGITGLALGNVGGIGFSAGIFGKVSIGDNKTIQVLAQTLIAAILERIEFEVIYRAAYYVPDQGQYHTFSTLVDQVMKIKVPAPAND